MCPHIISFEIQVTHLVIQRSPFFHYKPGDYVYLNIPVIARYEWHPFTISSAPEQPGRGLTDRLKGSCMPLKPRALDLTGASAWEQSPPCQKQWLCSLLEFPDPPFPDHPEC